MDYGKTIMRIQMLAIEAYILRKREEGVDESSNVLARRWIDDNGLEFRKLFRMVSAPQPTDSSASDS